MADEAAIAAPTADRLGSKSDRRHRRIWFPKAWSYNWRRFATSAGSSKGVSAMTMCIGEAALKRLNEITSSCQVGQSGTGVR